MSSLKAIAAVTQTLKSILDESINDESIDTLGAVVYTKPLDRLENDLTATENALNIYLYMVKENVGWRHQGLQSRNNAGQRISNPYLALDLYYVMSSHGSEKVNADVIFGYGLVAFHDNSIIGRDFIANTLAAEPLLVDAGLADQLVQITITAEYLSTEDISKIWTMFGAKYRQSAFYKVSVALLRKEKSVRQALPVLKSKLYVKPIKIPTINTIKPEERAGSDYLSNLIFIEGDVLIIEGVSFQGEVTMVQFDGDFAIGVEVELDKTITLPIPSVLRAGVHSIQIVHEMLLGEPAVPHKGIKSNLAAFVLSPVLENLAVAGDDLTGDVLPAIKEEVRYTILLNEIDFDTTSRNANEYSFNDMAEVEASSFSFNIADVLPGTYLVRISVNNATSPLFDDYTGPSIIIV